uniref:Uncharacterized protein n=1 Tax=Bombyx mori TaxID=7091 RepID=A0A8R2RAB2_BOMMO|nr:uncharacterized protein LOC119631173 [Bombyx mori]
MNSQLEEQVASLIQECQDTERQKSWLLERVIRSQRLGNELATAVKRQSFRVKKSKSTVTAEYTQARAVNEQLKQVMETMNTEFPQLNYTFEGILNMLNINGARKFSGPTEDGACLCIDEENAENVAEKPLCP